LNLSNKIFAKNGIFPLSLFPRCQRSDFMLRLIRAHRVSFLQTLFRLSEKGSIRLVVIGSAVAMLSHFFLGGILHQVPTNDLAGPILQKEESAAINVPKGTSVPHFLNRTHSPELPDFPSWEASQFKEEIGSLDAEFFSADWIGYEAMKDEEV
jgi:hypothetical protein